MHEAIVIGAGPAGLTAAIYLGRYLRPPLIIDAATSRARWIPESHNIIGFPHGVRGAELLAQLREHAQLYGASVRFGSVTGISIEETGFAVHLLNESIRSRCVVLATGIQDHLPELPGAESAVRRGLIRICPICDGYEARERHIAVLGDGLRAEREAGFMRSYSQSVTLLHLGVPGDGERRARLKASGIDLVEVRLQDLSIESDGVRLALPRGESRKFDVCYSALGCSPRNALATAIGATCDADGQLIVNAHCETSVGGLYAVGDVVRGLNQVVVAAAEGALAATHIHNRLRGSQ